MMYFDEFNLDRKRNVRNTSIRNYNCMGYALDTYSWLIAYLEDEETDPFPDGVEEEEQEEVLISCAKYLLNNFPLVPITREQAYNTRGRKQIIAFRIAKYDFHFMARRKNGKWYHKMGSTHIRPISKDSVFAPIWTNSSGDIYDSEILFFEKVA